MPHINEVTSTVSTAPASQILNGLPPRTTVIQRDLALARQQLTGYVRVMRHHDTVLGEEIEPPAQGDIRTQLLDEIARLERHLEALDTPVLMPNLMLHEAAGYSQSEHTAPTRR